ncbi:MAG TPA: sigma-70 family RNA polymerase sigma factor [Hyphomicrobium sp.]|nr:sigma-70 family RNA polymerase sigma factor [Hyphomicrobium sp.]
MSTAAELSNLLARVEQRDAAAFKAVYLATSSKLYGIILRILRRRDLADEVLQEVYVKIWDRAGDFNPTVASPITWMATIARNRALDEVRRTRPDSIEDHPELMDVPADDPSALSIVMRGEDGRRLADCLSRLDATRRQMVVLAYCEGLSRDDLAAKYAQPTNTIKTWLRRSLAQLKGCLSS